MIPDSNCACLGEGVYVPVLDGVALIPHAVVDETFLVSRTASAPGLFKIST